MKDTLNIILTIILKLLLYGVGQFLIILFMMYVLGIEPFGWAVFALPLFVPIGIVLNYFLKKLMINLMNRFNQPISRLLTMVLVFAGVIGLTFILASFNTDFPFILIVILVLPLLAVEMIIYTLKH